MTGGMVLLVPKWLHEKSRKFNHAKRNASAPSAATPVSLCFIHNVEVIVCTLIRERVWEIGHMGSFLCQHSDGGIE